MRAEALACERQGRRAGRPMALVRGIITQCNGLFASDRITHNAMGSAELQEFKLRLGGEYICWCNRAEAKDSLDVRDLKVVQGRHR